MTPEEQSKLFQPFSKLASKQGNKSGTGLGLVICKGFCEMMRGEITMHSEFGKGTTFTVRLPVDTSQGPAIRPPSEVDPVQTGAEPPEQTAEAPDPAATQNGRRPFAAFKRPADAAEAAAGLPADTARVVLVVDDDPAVREMMQRHLELQGFRVVTAADGFEALALAKQLRPAVITLDAIMPGLDGWAVLAALRTNAETSGIPVVMVTIDDNEERGFSLGAAEFVTKPIDWEQLSQILATYTGNKRDRSILVVDDEPEAREILRRNLERDGWEVLEAPHGSAALEVLATERPAAILLDLTMPVMDGFEFLAQYCQLAEWLAIPVLVITAKDPTPEEMEQLDGLVVRVLRKGQYNNEDLLKEIHRRVDKHIKSDTLEIKEEYDVAHPVG
jgi:CheY-like chemotaxis protein